MKNSIQNLNVWARIITQRFWYLSNTRELEFLIRIFG